jgi:hypothetical protein
MVIGEAIMEEQFLSCAKTVYGEDFKVLEQLISKTLNTLGIFPSKKGYGILKDAIIYRLIGFHSGANFKGGVYKTISHRYDCPEKTIESNIRHALKSAYDCGKLQRLNDIIGAEVLDGRYLISNLQFISLVAQHCYYNFK